MLAIRFERVGRKNRAQFQIVLQEHTVAPGGRHIEILGGYDPHQKTVVLREERIQYWLGQGAQSSDTAYNILVKNNLIKGDKRKVKLFKKVDPEAEKAAAEAAAAAEKAAADKVAADAAAKVAAEAPKAEEVVIAPVEALVEEKAPEAPAEEVK